MRPATVAALSRRPLFTTIAIQSRGIVTQLQRREGDISDAFVSLSGKKFGQLPSRYADLKTRLIAGKEDALYASWKRLLRHLQEEVPRISTLKSKAIPEIDFAAVKNGHISPEFEEQYRKTGVAVVRGVVSEQQALQWKQDIRDYYANNPDSKVFPPGNPQVFEFYFSTPQILARGHPNVLDAQKFLMSFWHSRDARAKISTNHPISYADRLRIRLPGDNAFALGPHIDGGSVERWEENGYGLGHVYDTIFNGNWESYDPWESSCRLPAVPDLYHGVGACSAFRMAQGWLSLSTTSAFEGTLLVNPLLRAATAYVLLRPFFTPKVQSKTIDTQYLDPDNWALESPLTSKIEGANPGNGQEVIANEHPHLSLAQTMVHVPTVQPGDYVAWHCDTIHAVDSVHMGASDSSVMYIPACPLTDTNARYLVRQRESFLAGTPSPDFGGGEGESKHIGRLDAGQVLERLDERAARAMGLSAWDSESESGVVREIMRDANKILGF